MSIDNQPADASHDTPFDQVPAASLDAELDHRYVEMRGGTTLPRTYLPPSMPGNQPQWIRGVALVVIAMFLGATAAGVCLTYGPPVFG
ncbi:MAG: hypothetical protein HQ526_02050 [Actinobacteria bacterium]|nr:hypothetical protein [Actinomycetota bacterium]